jgi:hypothetical protein
MTHQELAAKLNGREYLGELDPTEHEIAKLNRLVVVFGASDDLMEFRGAIHDEIGAYNGTTAKVTVNGLLPSWNELDHDDESEMDKYYAMKNLGFMTIKAIWCPKGTEMSWAYKTQIPHSTFDVMEDGEVYCRGIVFCLNQITT